MRGLRNAILLFAVFLAPAPVAAVTLNQCQDALRNPEAAVEICSRLIASRPPAQVLSNAYELRGVAWAKLKNPDSALQDYSSAIENDPTNWIAFGNRANVRMNQGRYDLAEADYNVALALHPQESRFWLNRGTLFWRKGEFDKAIADHTKAISLNPKDWTSFNNRSSDWKSKGDFVHALEDINQAIKLAPNEPMAYSARGELWRLMGDLRRAMEDQSRAIALVPHNLRLIDDPTPLILVRRGDIRRYGGHYDLALADYSEALRYAGGMTLAYTNRGLTYERMGNLDLARADFLQALSLPEFNSDSSQSAQATARARLAALESGAIQPVFPPSPTNARAQNSIPTPALSIPSLETKPPANDAKRIALIIGNSSYRNVPPLTNPKNDATAVAATLRNIGFQTVILAIDQTKEQMANSVREFASKADEADWAMVYYAGHGIEANGSNYLIPTDAVLKNDVDVPSETISLDQVMATVNGAKRLRLVVLDACRDNPFLSEIGAPLSSGGAHVNGGVGSGASSRSLGRGLGEVKVQGASLVVFAAKHGQTALDGDNGNSPFAIALVQRMTTPSVEIGKIFRLVRDDVMEVTAGRQEPYTYGSLPAKEEFYFVKF